MAHAGHDISLVSFAEHPDTPATRRELLSVCKDYEIVPFRLTRLTEGGDHLRRLRSVFSTLPYTVTRFHRDEMQECLARKLSEGAYDVFVCDNPIVAVNLPHIPIPLVINSHNLEYSILQQYARLERNPLKALGVSFEARRLRRFEIRTYGLANCAMTCSNADAEVIRSFHARLPVVVVPNAIDAAAYQVTDDEGPANIVYQGGMDWFPNRDALLYFVRQIFPHIEREFRPIAEDIYPDKSRCLPAVRLIAAGRNPPAAFRAKLSHVPALSFTGTLPDLRPVIAKATVCVVPLRIGSGTRFKILEAGAMGKAIVSTTLGAEGLSFEHGKEILIADDPCEFARCVIDLLRDPVRRKKLGQAARRRVNADYDLAALESSVVEALQVVSKHVGRKSTAASCDSLSRNPVV